MTCRKTGTSYNSDVGLHDLHVLAKYFRNTCTIVSELKKRKFPNTSDLQRILTACTLSCNPLRAEPLQRVEVGAGVKLEGLVRLPQSPESGRAGGQRPSVGKISARCCSFSAVSAPIFATKYAFCSIFQNLPDSQAEIFEI